MIIRAARKFWYTSAAIAILAWMPWTDVSAFNLEIDGDRISVQASQVPLQSLLKEVSGHGIAIRLDPDINPLITLSFQNRELEDGLKAVLRPHDHVFFWRASESDGTPGVPAYRLDEIHIFRPGLKGRMVSLPGTQPRVKKPAPVPALPDTKVVIVANKVFVPVILGYQDREVQTSLIFDTGAGTIILHQNVAEQLEIEATEASRGRGVGGIKIETRTARLNYVRVGPHKKENLRTDIIEYQGTADERYNGLLGMNFIRGLKYTIDFDQQVIHWLP